MHHDYDYLIGGGGMVAANATKGIHDGGVSLELDDGTRLEADAMVAGLGITPATELAEQAGLAVDNANAMGQSVGANMAGRREPYDYSPYFYPNVFELRYQALGELDSRLDTVEDWTTPQQQDVVYYLADGRLKGILLVNLEDRLDDARTVLRDDSTQRPESLLGRIR